jgi:hypothetical protein
MVSIVTCGWLNIANAKVEWKYVCKQLNDQGGKNIAVVLLEYDGRVQIQFGKSTAFGSYSESLAECHSKLACESLRISISATVPNAKLGEINTVNAEISEAGASALSSSISFYKRDELNPIIYNVECEQSF